jgi:manganese/iron transport system permease protein
MLAVSVAVSLLAGFLGIYASFFIDAAPAPTIVLVLTAIFVLAFLRVSLRRTVAAT